MLLIKKIKTFKLKIYIYILYVNALLSILKIVDIFELLIIQWAKFKDFDQWY